MPHFHEEALASFAGNARGSEAHNAAELHLAHCRPCLKEMVARGLEPDARIRSVPQALVEEAKRMGARRARRGWSVLAAAAVLAVVVAGVTLRNRQELTPILEPSAGVQRQGEERSGVDLVSPAEGAVLSPSHIVLAWTPVPGTRGYTVTILDERGAILFESSTTNTSITAGKLRAGRRYWSVTARTADGRNLESKLRAFDVGLQ